LLLPTSADLVGAFVKDLSKVLDVSVTQKPTRSIHFFALTGITVNWKADADYFCVAVLVSGTGNSWAFGFDTVVPAIAGVSAVYLDTKILSGPIATNETPGISGIRVPVPEGTRLYLVNQTAGSMAVNCFIEQA